MTIACNKKINSGTEGEGNSQAVSTFSDDVDGYYRFSESPIWIQQREFFKAKSSDAWAQGIVPYYVTSNPVMASYHVEMLINFWRDHWVANRIDPEQPVYVLELGSGSGTFSFLVLSRLFKRLAETELSHLKVVYIISDFVEENIYFCQQHEKLAGFVERGQLDFAVLDLEQSELNSLVLINQQKKLNQSNFFNPLSVIANYVFDGLTQDLVKTQYGQLYDGLIKLPKSDARPTSNSGKLVEQPEYQWQALRLSDNNNVESTESIAQFYNEKQQAILEYYLQILPNAWVLISSGAMNCMESLLKLSAQSLMILSADRGISRLDQLKKRSKPAFANHGSFSLPVNYHGLNRYVENCGGMALTSQREDSDLTLAAYLFDKVSQQDGAMYKNVPACFNQMKTDTSPTDIYTIKKALGVTAHLLTPGQMLAHLHLSQWDYRVLSLFFPGIIDCCTSLDATMRMQWIEGLTKTWNNFYPMRNNVNSAFNMGVLAIELGAWGLAKKCYRTLLDYFREDTGAIYNLALCHAKLGELDTADELLVAAVTTLEQALTKIENRRKNPDLKTAIKVGIKSNFRKSMGTRKKQKKAIQEQLVLCNQLLEMVNQWKHDQPAWYKAALFKKGELSLQPLHERHSGDYYYQTSDTEISVMTRLPCFENPSELESWISAENEQASKSTFAVVHQSYGFVGVVGLNHSDDISVNSPTNESSTGEKSGMNQSALLYFWTGMDYQGRGYATKAIEILINAVEPCFGITKLFTSVYNDNYCSLQLLKKLNWEFLPVRAKEPDDVVFLCCATGERKYEMSAKADTCGQLKKLLHAIDCGYELNIYTQST